MARQATSDTQTTRMERIHRSSPTPGEPLVARGQTYEAGLKRLQPLEPERVPRPGQELMRNLSVASALVLCVVALRAGTLTSSPVDAVLTAASGDSLLDDRLGKLSFVSSVFPEAALVFGESDAGLLSAPVSGGQVVHAWSRQEPYITWSATSDQVTAAMSGEVRGVYHANGDEVLVQVAGDGGLMCVYGNLAESCVSTGDQVQEGGVIGTLLPGEALAFEVQQDGCSIDPVSLLNAAQ